MKPIFWLLAAGLFVVMLAYNVCQPPQVAHRLLQ